MLITLIFCINSLVYSVDIDAETHLRPRLAFDQDGKNSEKQPLIINHHNILSEDAFDVVAEGEMSIKFIKIWEEVLNEICGENNWALSIGGSLVHMNDVSGKLFWDGINDIDVWVFTTSDNLSKKEAVYELLKERGLPLSEKTYLRLKKDKRIFVDLRLLEFDHLTSSIDPAFNYNPLAYYGGSLTKLDNIIAKIPLENIVTSLLNRYKRLYIRYLYGNAGMAKPKILPNILIQLCRIRGLEGLRKEILSKFKETSKKRNSTLKSSNFENVLTQAFSDNMIGFNPAIIGEETLKQEIRNNLKNLMFSSSLQPLKGPFRVDREEESRRLCYVEEITDPDEIKETVNAWFSSEEKHTFKRKIWEDSIRLHPYGMLLKLESDGEILGIAFFHKQKFTRDSNMVPFYFLDVMEVTQKYRKQKLGKILVAKIIEVSTNDPDVGDMLIEMVTLNESDEWWIKKIGAVPTSDHSLGIYRSAAQKIPKEAKNRIVHVLRAKTMLGKKEGHGDFLHLSSASPISETILAYKEIIKKELGNESDVDVFIRKINRKPEVQKWYDLSLPIHIMRTVFFEGMDIEVSVEGQGDLPEEVLEFIMENIVKTLEDQFYIAVPDENLLNSPGRLKAMLLDLKAGRLEIPPKKHSTEL